MPAGKFKHRHFAV